MFVQSQQLPWVDSLYPQVLPGVQMRRLSHDPQSGAATVMARLPARWQNSDSSPLGAQQELFVLAGGLTIGAQRFEDHSYACFPQGYSAGAVCSEQGAIVLLMWDREPRRQGAAAAAANAVDTERLVPYINARVNGLDSWQKNTHTRYLPGTGVQTLRQDPESGEITILYSALPFRFMDRRWTHEHVQEMFVIAGEYSINDVGLMRPGAYAWWEPERLHGPYGSLTGFMMLIRSCGGPLVNVIPEERVAVDFAAPHRPQLPLELAAYCAPWDGFRCY